MNSSLIPDGSSIVRASRASRDPLADVPVRGRPRLLRRRQCPHAAEEHRSGRRNCRFRAVHVLPPWVHQVEVRARGRGPDGTATARNAVKSPAALGRNIGTMLRSKRYFAPQLNSAMGAHPGGAGVVKNDQWIQSRCTRHCRQRIRLSKRSIGTSPSPPQTIDRWRCIP